MSESFSNTNSSAYTTPAIQPAGTSTTQVAANNQAPAEQTTVPVGENNIAAVETSEDKKTNTAKTTGINFDTDNKTISSYYAQKYLSGLKYGKNFTYDPNSDVNYSLTNSVENPVALKDAFLRSFQRQADGRKHYNDRKSFEQSDNINYKYGTFYYLGNWIHTRTPIDENGNAIGLPEPMPQTQSVPA